MSEDDSFLPKLGAAIELIKRFEGFRASAYKDPVGIWTIGYGTTEGVFPGQICTEAQATAWLYADALRCAEKIQQACRKRLTDNQLCALVSLSYNIGIHALTQSHLMFELNAGSPLETVAAEFLKWNHAGGKVLPGLTRRREVERELFLKA